jgi:pilus assembly protein CpaF
MFGKRTGASTPLANRISAATGAPAKPETSPEAPRPAAAGPAAAPAAPARQAPPPPPPPPPVKHRSETFYQTKTIVFGAMLEAIDIASLAKVAPATAREEIRDIVSEIIQIKNISMSLSEQEDLLDDICNDILGFGPLEPLLARDDIADIMVNGAERTFIEVGG